MYLGFSAAAKVVFICVLVLLFNACSGGRGLADRFSQSEDSGSVGTNTTSITPAPSPTISVTPNSEPTPAAIGTPIPGSTPTPVPSTIPTLLPTSTPGPNVNAAIHLNQAGFHANAPKIAVVPATDVTGFTILSDDTSEVVFRGQLSTAATWGPAAETVQLADFSTLTQAGSYYLQVENLGDSYTFSIGDANLYSTMLDAAIKAYYFNRASTGLLSEHAGIFARPAGHPDTNVLIHASAASSQRPTGTSIVAAKGWYDAGDYNKYVVNSGISVYTLLAAYEHFPSAFTRDLAIPESGNDMPDILDEAMWNIEWMLSMQDPNDGGGLSQGDHPQF